MQPKSVQAGERTAARAKAVGLTGTVLTGAEVDALEADLGLTFPTWLRQFWTEVALCGIQLGSQEQLPAGDDDGVRFVEWATEADIRSESLECYPGLAIHALGYVNVAGNDGSGDPLFVCIHDGDDPPFYRVFHDVSDKGEVIVAKGRELVAPTLSAFLDSAIVRPA
jgi:hypothetical protein